MQKMSVTMELICDSVVPIFVSFSNIYVFFVQAAKAIKTSEFMPFVVFIGAPPVEIMRNMHEYAKQRGKTDKYKTVRFIYQFIFSHFSLAQ